MASHNLKTFKFAKISHPKFGSVEPFTFDIKLLSEEPPTPGALAIAAQFDVDKLKKSLRLDILKQCRDFWTDLLDEEILEKIDDRIELTLHLHYWDEDSEYNEDMIRILALNYTAQSAGNDCFANMIGQSSTNEDGDTDDDSLLGNLTYPLIVSMTPMMGQFVHQDDVDPNAALGNFPQIDPQMTRLCALGAVQGKNYQGHPLFASATAPEEREKTFKQSVTNLSAVFLLHIDRHLKRKDKAFSLDTYDALLQHDEGVLAQLRMMKILHKCKIPDMVKQDLLLQRLDSIYGETVVRMISLFKVHQDIQEDTLMQNSLLIQYWATRLDDNNTEGLKKVLDYFIKKIHNGVNDMELISKMLVKCFPDDEEQLNKHLAIMKHTFNGYVNYFYNKS